MAASTMPLKLAAVASVLLFIGLGIYLAPLQPSVVALQLTFTPEAFAQVLQAWGPEGVQRFRNHLPVDGLLVLSYGLTGYWVATRTRFFDSLLRWLPARWLAWLLPFAAACDAGEDVLHALLTSPAAANLPPSWYLLAGLCATFKWLGILEFAVAAVLARWRRVP